MSVINSARKGDIAMIRGEKVCAFIEHFCIIPEGAQVLQPIKLMKFQKQFILDVYDKPHGTSRAYLSVGRKNDKSAPIAAVVLILNIMVTFARFMKTDNCVLQNRSTAIYTDDFLQYL